MRKIIIGVMGLGNQANPKDLENAYQLRQLIAQQGWVLLTGGRAAGVMGVIINNINVLSSKLIINFTPLNIVVY